MKERDELAEHDWQLAEDQTFPKDRAVKNDAKVWQCTKCLEKVYLRNKPPPRYHRDRPGSISGFRMNWDGLDDVDKIGCTELVLKAVHES